MKFTPFKKLVRLIYLMEFHSTQLAVSQLGYVAIKVDNLNDIHLTCRIQHLHSLFDNGLVTSHLHIAIAPRSPRPLSPSHLRRGLLQQLLNEFCIFINAIT